MKLLAMVKRENKLKERKKIGVLGGTFDPAHKGHLEISKQAKKRFKLEKVVWAITRQNPLKTKSKSNLKDRIQFAKNFVSKNIFIKVRFYEDKIGSNKTIDLIEHLNKNDKIEIYFIMGADNVINLHKWHKWKSIIKKCEIIVFDRKGYKSKSLRSVAFSPSFNKSITFINFKKVNISSSQLRKI